MENKEFKILFVGDLNDYTRTYQRYSALSALGHEVFGVSEAPIPWRAKINTPSFVSRVFWRLKFPLDRVGVNKKILTELGKEKFDIVWIEKGNLIRPATLKYIKTNFPETKLISSSEDDMGRGHNRSLYYLFGLKYYDIVFTTKTYNLDELKTLGAKKTELFLDTYNEDIHHPMDLTPGEKETYSAEVGFAGSFEEDRAQRMLYLAQNGIKIVVWGNDWGSWLDKHQNLFIKNRHLFGIDYSKAINATKINLCFLRKLNRDLVTSRTVEIPACGGFMLGERTSRQLELFREGGEVEFFDSNEELLNKVRYYLEHDAERKNIAAAGRERCLRSGYGMRQQLAKMLAKTMADD